MLIEADTLQIEEGVNSPADLVQAAAAAPNTPKTPQFISFHFSICFQELGTGARGRPSEEANKDEAVERVELATVDMGWSTSIWGIH